MHISLDSELGRQRRLNQIGETITSIATPAAAYSLRSLTGGDPKVVRVRRDSDNDEQDFTASEVSSGALVNYVNAQTTKPLDVRELVSGSTDDGRTGNFVLAKAAYSLRSLGDRQATTAQGDVPLDEDTVQAPSGKYVVQVRRSSNDNIKSFTADEVTNGTLVDFCLDETKQFIGESYQYFAGSSSSKVDLSSAITLSGDFDISFSAVSLYESNYNGYMGASNNYIRIRPSDNNLQFRIAGGSSNSTTLTTNISSSSVHTFRFVRASGTITIFVDGIQQSSTISDSGAFVIDDFGRGGGGGTDLNHKGLLYNININSQAAYLGYGATPWNDTIGSNNGTANNTENFTGQGFDGFVRALYDQSVRNEAGTLPTGNHAIQSTAANQPKVVENGSLVSGGVLFTGSSEGLLIASASTLGITGSTNRSIISVIKTTSGTDGFIPFGNDSASGTSTSYRHRSSNTSGLSRVEIQGSGFEGADVSDGNTHLFSSILNGTQLQNVSIFVDGSETAGSGTATLNTANNNFFIGSITGSLSENTGTLAELIVYDSDQTDNRGAFEANIAEHYNISGIPAEDNQVNGFVETWYDQSGNGNDVTQTTATKQPKIVNSGSLVLAGSKASLKFDGTDFFRKRNLYARYFVST